MERYYGITRAAPYQRPQSNTPSRSSSDWNRYVEKTTNVVQEPKGFVNPPQKNRNDNDIMQNSKFQQGKIPTLNQYNQSVIKFERQLQSNNENQTVFVRDEENMTYPNYYVPKPYQQMSVIMTPMQNEQIQASAPTYSQLNMFRFNPQESKVFGNNQSNFSATPRADIYVSNVQSVKSQKEHPVAQGEKLAETPSGGSLYYGQASVQTQNGHMQAHDNKITTVEKHFGSAITGCSGSETLNKRYSSDNASTKFSADKQKKISSFGMRIFTGSVEKVLKWYKTLSDIEIDYIFEVIGKCLNIRNGQGCEKIILIRDSTGPVLQVIYYEIDYLLPEINAGSIVRIVGKMIGTNRMQGFKIRHGSDSEINALPRLCAIGHHVITKLKASNNSR